MPILFPVGSSSSAILDNPDDAHTSEGLALVAALPVDCDLLLTPPVQRKLLGCFFDRISAELPPVLSEQHDNMFRQDINPLLTYSIDPNPWLRLILLHIYAISARLLSRDLHPEYAYLEHACQTELQRALPMAFNKFHAFEPHAFDQVTVACLSILYELVGPGRSRISLDVLNTSQMLFAVASYVHKEDDARLQLVARLAFFLSQVEAYVDTFDKPWVAYATNKLHSRSICLHYKRPSAQFYALCALSNHNMTWLDISMEFLQKVQGHYDSNTETMLNSILSNHGTIHNLSPTNQELDELALLLTLNQHPIFSTDLGWIMSSDPEAACPCTIGLFEQVTQAARLYLQLMSTRQKSQQTVLCIWLTMERIMQAGFLCVIHLLFSMKASKTSKQTEIDSPSSLEPLMQCTSLLVYLTEKWTPGRPYYVAWELIYMKIVDAFSKTIYANK